MDYKIVDVAEFKVIGMEYRGTETEPIKKLWEDLMPRYQEIKANSEEFCYGVCEMLDEKTMEFTYLACRPVDNFVDIPNGMISKTVPAGKYAVFTHKGSLDNLKVTYEYIYGEWIKSGVQKHRHAPDFELYDKRFKFGEDDSEMDIYVPIE